MFMFIIIKRPVFCICSDQQNAQMQAVTFAKSHSVTGASWTAGTQTPTNVEVDTKDTN